MLRLQFSALIRPRLSKKSSFGFYVSAKYIWRFLGILLLVYVLQNVFFRFLEELIEHICSHPLAQNISKIDLQEKTGVCKRNHLDDLFSMIDLQEKMRVEKRNEISQFARGDSRRRNM